MPENPHSYISDSPDHAPDGVSYAERIESSKLEIEQLARILELHALDATKFLKGSEANILHVGSGYGAVTEMLLQQGSVNIIDLDEDPVVIAKHQSNPNLENVPIIEATVSEFFANESMPFSAPLTTVIGLNVSADAITSSLEEFDTPVFSTPALALFTVWQPTEITDPGRIDDIGPVKEWIEKNQDAHPTLRFIVVDLNVDKWEEKYAFIAYRELSARS